MTNKIFNLPLEKSLVSFLHGKGSRGRWSLLVANLFYELLNYGVGLSEKLFKINNLYFSSFTSIYIVGEKVRVYMSAGLVICTPKRHIFPEKYSLNINRSKTTQLQLIDFKRFFLIIPSLFE